MNDHTPPHSNSQRHGRNHSGPLSRSISAPLLSGRLTLAGRAIRWAVPWSRDTFPGLRAGVLEILGRPSLAWATVQGWRAERSRLPAEDAERLAQFIRSRSQQGLSLTQELEDYAAKRRTQPRSTRGFQVVKDWDGTGVLRDARWRGGRRKNDSQ